jgi:hypothetical protein
MMPSLRTSLMLSTPVASGGRLLVPVVRRLTVIHETGGYGSCTPVALLVGEGDAWTFVPLEEGIGQEVLAGIDLSGMPRAGSEGGCRAGDGDGG